MFKIKYHILPRGNVPYPVVFYRIYLFFIPVTRWRFLADFLTDRTREESRLKQIILEAVSQQENQHIATLN
jgi:hypothetical protein